MDANNSGSTLQMFYKEGNALSMFVLMMHIMHLGEKHIINTYKCTFTGKLHTLPLTFDHTQHHCWV